MISMVAGSGSALMSNAIKEEARCVVLDEKKERPTLRVLLVLYAVVAVPESMVVSRTPVGISTVSSTKLPYCMRYHASSASTSPAITAGTWKARSVDHGPYSPSTMGRTSHTTDPMPPRSLCGV